MRRMSKSISEMVEKKYKTLDALNHAWWSAFWSHTYTDWEQIHSPSPRGEDELHGLKLDWKRFVSEQLQDFCVEKRFELLKHIRIFQLQQT